MQPDPPRCPHCGAECFDCTTDDRGLCVAAPKMEQVDDCSGCEGQDVLDDRGLCSTCAHEVDHDPWRVISAATGEVVRPGPYSRDHAEHVARMNNDRYFRSDSGSGLVRVRAERINR